MGVESGFHIAEKGSQPPLEEGRLTRCLLAGAPCGRVAFLVEPCEDVGDGAAERCDGVRRGEVRAAAGFRDRQRGLFGRGALDLQVSHIVTEAIAT